MTAAMCLGAVLGACDPDVEDGEARDPVPCGDVECTVDEVCVKPEWECDYSACSEDPEGAEWIMPPSHCAPFPNECAHQDSLELSQCMAEAHCENPLDYLGYDPEARELNCDQAIDCFCY